MTVCKYKLLYYVCTVAHACLIVMPATVPQLILRSVSSFSGSAMALRCPDAIPSSSHSLSHVLSIHTGFPFPVAFSLSLSLFLSLVPRPSSLVNRLVFASSRLLFSLSLSRSSSLVNRQSSIVLSRPRFFSSCIISSRLLFPLSLYLSLSLSLSLLSPLSLSFSLSFSLSLSAPFAHLSYQERTGAPRQTLVLEVGTVGGACWHKSPPTGSGVLGFGLRASTSASSFPLPLIDADTSYRTECHVMSYRPIRSVCIDERQKLPG